MSDKTGRKAFTTKFKTLLGFSIATYILLFINVFTNLSYLGLWKVWNLSGYAFLFSLLFSTIFDIDIVYKSFVKKGRTTKIGKEETKRIIIISALNLVCIACLVSSFFTDWFLTWT